MAYIPFTMDFVNPPTFHCYQVLAISIGIWVLYQTLITIYNISPLHPLSHIPGPVLARATYLPEFYYDLIRTGRYTKQIQIMHNKYGPIVRISPNETHCNDVDFIDEIYATSNRKREKPLHFVRGSMFGECAFDTIDHDLHKIRRTVIAKYFTRGMVNQSEKDIHQLTQTLCNKLLISPNDPIDIIEAYNCYTADSICYYLFGEGFGFLNQKGWSLNLHHNIRSVGITRFIFRFFPVFAKLLDLSYHFINYVLPDDIRFLFRTFKVELPNRIQNIRTEIDSGIIRDRPTVFGSLLRLEPEQRKHLNFTDEAALITNAASGTTTWALTVITYHILNKPEILANLTQELNKIVDDPQHLPPLSLLESLPYLAGVIQEGLRLSYGAAGRSPRVPIDEDLIYRGEWKKKPVSYVIPRGYAIGMSSFIIHHNDDVFPNSHSFVPERWLDSKSRKILTRHMFAFSRGGRNCLGMNFALCELYMAVAALTLRVFPRMHLFQTTEEDVAYDYDIFSPMPKASSKGVRVVLTAI